MPRCVIFQFRGAWVKIGYQIVSIRLLKEKNVVTGVGGRNTVHAFINLLQKWDALCPTWLLGYWHSKAQRPMELRGGEGAAPEKPTERWILRFLDACYSI